MTADREHSRSRPNAIAPGQRGPAKVDEAIVDAIEGLKQYYERVRGEDAPAKKSERLWQRFEVIGLWAAAVVGVLAIIIGSKDSVNQYEMMHRQLDAMHAEDRAFVNATELRIEQINDRGGNPDYWKISPILNNSGNTATVNMNYFPGYFRFFKNNSNIIPLDPDSTDISFSPGKRNPVALGPKGEIRQETYIVTKDQAADLAGGRISIYIMGLTTYRDVFEDDPARQTKFCFKLFGDIGDTGVSSKYGDALINLDRRPGVSARPCFHNNCTDDDCPRA